MIRVFLVDDQTLVRQGVRSLLELSDAVQVIGEARDGDEAIAEIPRV
ncbi:MAG: DNA-binding response regulator, partial [Rhodanobacteraceae bacterium]|nr:DNA-binding response regulator [Rhodanobacteraceae bacterium]